MSPTAFAQGRSSGSAATRPPDQFATGASPSDVTEQFRALGDLRGRVVMVHAAVRRLGPVRAGAAGLIEALRAVVGPDGTLVMMVAADDAQPFDPAVTPADPANGVLAEVFRTSPGVEVNDHPACRFAVSGPAAASILWPQPRDHYYGPGSPLERLVEEDGLVLRLGADPDTVTLTHFAEYLAEVPDKRSVIRSYRMAGADPITVEALDDTNGIAHWGDGDYFPRIWLDYRRLASVSRGPVGDVEAELFGARDFVTFAVHWLEEHLGYGCGHPSLEGRSS